jgi:hypothetical protein
MEEGEGNSSANANSKTIAVLSKLKTEEVSGSNLCMSDPQVWLLKVQRQLRRNRGIYR